MRRARCVLRHQSMKHRSALQEKCPECLSRWGALGDTPQIRNEMFAGPYKDPKGTRTKVTSAKGPFCAYPNPLAIFQPPLKYLGGRFWLFCRLRRETPISQNWLKG